MLAETVRDSRTISRTGPGGIEISVTNQISTYRRGPKRGTPTLMEKFLSTANGTPGSGSGLIATASDLGIEEASPVFLDEAVSVSGDRITLVIPERARKDGAVRLAELMALHHGNAFPTDELTSRGENNYLVNVTTLLPNAGVMPADTQQGNAADRDPVTPTLPNERWLPENEQWVNAGDSLQCLVCLGERSPRSVFGIEQMPGRPVEPGETVPTEDTLFFVPAPKEMPSPNGGQLQAAFEQGAPIPAGQGQPFGLTALATPNASVMGQPANPVVGMDTKALLQREATRRLLGGTFTGSDSTVEWASGAMPLTAAPDLDATGNIPATLLGEKTTVNTFIGVVEAGDSHPWSVLVNIARVTKDDHVIVAGGTTWPTGGQGTMAPSTVTEGDTIPARRFTAEAMSRFGSRDVA